MAGDLIDPLSAAGIADAAVQRALAALRNAQAARNAAASSQNAAADALAKVQALSKAIGVQTIWSGPNKTVLSILGPGGTYGPGSDLQGQEGPVGETPTFHIGTVSEGDFAVVAHADDPANVILDFVLSRGLAAWTPVPAAAADGARRVLQIVDWTGGQGAKPSTGLFVGSAGLVADIASAVDFRGLPGGGGTVTSVGSTTHGHLVVYGADGTQIGDGGALTPLGASIVAAATAAAVKQVLAIAAGDVTGLGGAALLNVGTTAGTVAAANDSRLVGAEQTANKGQANGYAGLDSTGKVPTASLPASVVGDVRYAGAWNAAANSPPIPAASSANMGSYYVVQTAGTTSINGVSDWQSGDWLVSNGTGWDKIDNTDAVKSVAGLVGAITAIALKQALAIAASDVSGLAAVATSASASDLSAGTLPGARLPAFTGGDVTSAVGTLALTIAAGAVTFAKLATAAVATLSDAFTNTASKLLSVTTLWAMQAFVAVTDAATLAVDLNTGLNFKVTLGGNRTLGNPSNAKEGQSGVIRVLQDATGSRTLSFGTAWDFGAAGAPTLQTAAGKEDLITYVVVDAAAPRLRCSFSKGA